MFLWQESILIISSFTGESLVLVRSGSFVPRRFSDSSGVPPNDRVPWSNTTLSRVKMLNESTNCLKTGYIWIQYIYVLDVYDIHIVQYIRHTKKETMCNQTKRQRPEWDLTLIWLYSSKSNSEMAGINFCSFQLFSLQTSGANHKGTSPSLLRCWAQSGLLSCVRPLEMRRRRQRHRAKAGAGKPSGDSQVHNYWNSTRVCVSHPCVMFFSTKIPTRSDDEKLKRLTHRWISFWC